MPSYTSRVFPSRLVSSLPPFCQQTKPEGLRALNAICNGMISLVSRPRSICAAMAALPLAFSGPLYAAQTIMEEVVVTAQKRKQTM